MKKCIFTCICLIIIFACKKEGGPGKQLYLSKIFINDLLSEEYIYSSDMKVIRRNHYNTGGGQSVFGGFRLYEYQDGSISSMMAYTEDGDLYDKKEMKYNDAKKLSRVDAYGGDENMDYYYTFQYDNTQSYKMLTYSPNPVKKTGEWQFTLDAQNRVVLMKRYYVSSGNLIFNDSIQVAWSGKTIPAHWQFYEELMVEFPVQRSIENIFADSYFYYLSGGPPSTATHTFTQKSYNNQGYLASQHYKLEAYNGISTTITNYNLKYEYIE